MISWAIFLLLLLLLLFSVVEFTCVWTSWYLVFFLHTFEHLESIRSNKSLLKSYMLHWRHGTIVLVIHKHSMECINSNFSKAIIVLSNLFQSYMNIDQRRSGMTRGQLSLLNKYLIELISGSLLRCWNNSIVHILYDFNWNRNIMSRKRIEYLCCDPLNLT